MTRHSLIDDAKARIAYSRRRLTAVRSHARTVVTAGLDATKTLAAVARRDAEALAQRQKAILTDRALSFRERGRQLRAETAEAAATARQNLQSAAVEGIGTVRDKLSRVLDVTHAEQATENKIARKIKKAQRNTEEPVIDDGAPGSA